MCHKRFVYSSDLFGIFRPFFVIGVMTCSGVGQIKFGWFSGECVPISGLLALVTGFLVQPFHSCAIALIDA